MKSFHTSFISLVLFLYPVLCFSQSKLQIENGDLVIISPNEQEQSQMLYKNEQGQSRLKQKNTTIESDSTKYFDARNYAEAMGNVYINQNDSVDIYSNLAKYFGNERRAELIGEVALIQDVYTLQTEKLNYNLDTRIATYNTGGELSDTTSTLTSKVGSYDVGKEEAVFIDSVVLISPDRRIETDTLTYNMKDKWAYFNGPTTIYEENQVITTTKGKYNTETGEAMVEGDPEIDSEDSFFKADSLQLNREGGVGKATGNVYYFDKVNEVELYSDFAEQLDSNTIRAIGNVDITSQKDSINLKSREAIMNQTEEEFQGRGDVILTILNQETELLTDSLDVFQKEGYSIAQGRNFLTTVEDGDSIFMTALTLEGFRQDQTPDSTYNFVANKNIKIFKSDLQAIADSAYVNNIDSTITLFKNPVIWSDSTQMSADTIRIFLVNKEINKVEFRSNCFFINLVEEGLHNQMKGRMMDAYFVEGKIDNLFVNGNAETIFYAQDDADAFVGIDKMTSGQIKVFFKDGEMDEVLWLKEQEGTTYPFQDVSPEQFRLPGFAWRESQKPYGKDFIMIASGRKEGELPEVEIVTAPVNEQNDPTKVTLSEEPEEEEENANEQNSENIPRDKP